VRRAHQTDMTRSLGVSLLIAAIALANPLEAQSPPADTTGRDPRLNLLRGIALSPVQKAQLDSVEAAMAAHTKEADAKSNSAGEVTLRLRQRLAERDKAVRVILTPEQLIVYQRNVDSLRAWAARERH
jgi:hypothetical protein